MGDLSRLQLLEAHLGVEFTDPGLLIEALTHKSYLREFPDHPTSHNERLEFLGDAVIGLIVADVLFERFPDASEGDLTNYRSALVCRTTLNGIGQSLKLDEESFWLSTYDRRKKSRFVCGDVFEAVVGALFRDKGMEACRLFLDRFLFPQMMDLIAEFKSYKNMVQHEVSKRFHTEPTYQMVERRERDGSNILTAACLVNNVVIAQAEGVSKQMAEVAAAKLALETIGSWSSLVSGS